MRRTTVATSANTLATWIARWKDGVKERDGDEGENEKERRERVERKRVSKRK